VFERVRLAVALLDVSEAATAVFGSTSELGLGAKFRVNCHVVVSELAHLSIIDTDDLGLLVGAETAAGDEVHDPEDDGGHDKRVGDTSARVGELMAKLDPVVVEPTSRDGGETVECGDGSLSKEAGADVADDTTNGVSSEDIEAIIVVKEELELGCPIASSATKDTKGNSSGGADESRAGSDGNETGDGSGAEADNRPLPLKTPIPEHPGKTADGSSEVGDDASLDSAQVGTESRSSVESEPSEPEEDSAKDNVGGVMGLVGKTLSSVSAALSEVKGDSEGSSAGRNVHRGSSSEVETAHLERPTVGVPSPAGNGIVNKG